MGLHGGEFEALVNVQETERARIARDLHDGVGQKLTLLQLGVDRIARASPSEEHRALLHELSVQIAEIASELHSVSHQLHPLKLEILGLAKSIETLCDEMSRRSGVDITFSFDEALPDRIGCNESLCLYRVAQEALQNVVKHSNAERARVRLSSPRDALELVVADAGDGFDKSVATNGLGLTSMRQRVQLPNGTIAVSTRGGHGTRICVRIPFRRHSVADGVRVPQCVTAAPVMSEDKTPIHDPQVFGMTTCP